MRLLPFAPLLLLASGCGETTYSINATAAPAAYAAAETRYRDDRLGNAAEESHHEPSHSADPSRPDVIPSRDVLILQGTHLDKPSEVVGIIDVHEEMGRHDVALDELRRKAAAMGADAVVGVEFHHDEGQGTPTHLSGLAVRFVQFAN